VAESGGELALFAHARNWKRYVAAELAPYIVGRVLEVGAGTGNTTEALSAGAIDSWLCLEPNAELASEIVAKIAGARDIGHRRLDEAP
jgi:16S rRNA A1518/A1519 N6-dimethyltransferase RsmA/KsgA/DIM1 with predicted DNA glycosylase/AP lyase activity